MIQHLILSSSLEKEVKTITVIKLKKWKYTIEKYFFSFYQSNQIFEMNYQFHFLLNSESISCLNINNRE